jgi:uncharacterized protein YukE
VASAFEVISLVRQLGSVSGATKAVAFGAALSLAVKAAEMFAREINASVERVRQFTDFRLGAGATTAAAGQATAILSALGISGGRQGALAAGIRDAIAAGGLARGAASQLGVGGVAPRGFGGPSDVDVLIRLADGIRKVTTEQEAYNLAIKLGAPELLRFRLLGNEQIQNIRRLGDEIKRVYSPEAQQRLARFQAELEIRQSYFYLRLFQAFDAVLKFFHGPNTELQDALDNLKGALSNNTAAVQSNTVAIGQSRQIFGGGGNAQNALPAGLRGELLRKQIQGGRITWGII